MEITSTSFLYFVSTLSLGVLSPIETYTSIHVGTNHFDTEQPMISFGAQHHIDKVSLFVEHQSSPMTLEDKGLNHIGFKYNFDNNFYIGSSKKIDACDSCSKEPLIIGGYEKENFFIEYSDDRIYSGLKFSF
tara:strand:- start:52 stop:447 length:396 start_codon:yes stop_codon:yes gene_type:complete